MFGLDICGLQKRIVHVIINHNGTNYNCKSSPKCKDDVFTHVYTLHLYASNWSYEVRIDNESVQAGNLTDDWPILQPREIAYPSDAKPSDWDDRERIADPNDKIPDNWELPKLIEDIEATKSDDWDEEADGDWFAPMKTNPAYMGKGPWIAKQIPNLEYVEDYTLEIFKDIGLIGIDVRQVMSGTIFGDFLITDDVDLATQAADAIVETSKKERTVKKKIDDKEIEKMRASRKPTDDKISDGGDDKDFEDMSGVDTMDVVDSGHGGFGRASNHDEHTGSSSVHTNEEL
ncbi:hypothetical protein GJ496_003550 [Pomphorhynchus laevis]|nr:hypothetical protein GJ496_003550 [Pomphorhynchus laevis]